MPNFGYYENLNLDMQKLMATKSLVRSIGDMLVRHQKCWMLVNFTNNPKMSMKLHSNGIKLCGIITYLEGGWSKKLTFYYLVPFELLCLQGVQHMHKICTVGKFFFFSKVIQFFCMFSTCQQHVGHAILCLSFHQHINTCHFQMRLKVSLQVTAIS